MKTLIARLGRQVVPGLTLAALAATTTLHAQTAPPPGAPVSVQTEPAKLSAADLQDLLGPIALYPDALVSIILPASTVPSDIAMAVRYLNQNGDEANVDDQPWDPSVRALAKYPDVLRWMDENLEWTTSLGEAFVVQPADVMNAVQELRLAAKDTGNLRNTAQQTVVVEKAPVAQTETVREVIRIVPTDPEVIYVPVYDPQVVYVEPYQPDYVTPLITFGVGFAVGSWLNYDCDWYNDDIYWGSGCGWNNRNRWYDRGWNDGDVNVTNVTNVNNITNIVNNNNGAQWQPNANARRYFSRRQQQNIGNARVARANANIRQPSARELRDRNQRKQYLANRRERVSQPQRAKPITRNTAANRPKNAKAQAAAAAKRPADRPADRPKAAQVPNDRPKAQTQQGNRKKPASPAPQLNGDNRTAKKPADRPAGKGNQPATNRQNKKPTQAPAVNADGSTAKPKKNTAKPGNQPAQNNRQASRDDAPRPKKPAPQASASKPKAQRQDADQPARPKTPRPQVQEPQRKPKPQAQPQQQRKPKPQAQPQQQRKPQPQAQPQQQRKPKPQAQPQQQRKPQQAQPTQRPKAQSSGQPSGNSQKKKKKTDDD